MILFHGSDVVVQNPRVLKTTETKDFGVGFYCTEIKQQAQNWAMRNYKDQIVSAYTFSKKSIDGLNVKMFYGMSEEWLDFIVECRLGKNHSYDIVDGPMADDKIWMHVGDLIKGDITRKAFWELIMFNHPTHQVVFCTRKALKSIEFGYAYRTVRKGMVFDEVRVTICPKCNCTMMELSTGAVCLNCV